LEILKCYVNIKKKTKYCLKIQDSKAKEELILKEKAKELTKMIFDSLKIQIMTLILEYEKKPDAKLILSYNPYDEIVFMKEFKNILLCNI
jgi:hypothetical protein